MSSHSRQSLPPSLTPSKKAIMCRLCRSAITGGWAMPDYLDYWIVSLTVFRGPTGHNLAISTPFRRQGDMSDGTYDLIKSKHRHLLGSCIRRSMPPYTQNFTNGAIPPKNMIGNGLILVKV
ncbi:hypothetical protein BDV30DRAFT_212508, partial [Aspergillus minisclerotigenes]